MVTTKREYVLATCFLSGSAAIISLVALGTQEWIWADARSGSELLGSKDRDYVRIGLFGGLFNQATGSHYQYELTTVCVWDLNVCAALCGNDMEINLQKLYYGEDESPSNEYAKCPRTGDEYNDVGKKRDPQFRTLTKKDRVFINAGAWLSTVVFVVLSAAMGVIASCLALWNTVANPTQTWLSVLGLYVSNAIAFFSILVAVAVWGALFALDLIHALPTYQTILDDFHTDAYAHLGYSYWINLGALVLYIISLCLLYLRSYLMSREPEIKLPDEDMEDPSILRLY